MDFLSFQLNFSVYLITQCLTWLLLFLHFNMKYCSSTKTLTQEKYGHKSLQYRDFKKGCLSTKLHEKNSGFTGMLIPSALYILIFLGNFSEQIRSLLFGLKTKKHFAFVSFADVCFSGTLSVKSGCFPNVFISSLTGRVSK